MRRLIRRLVLVLLITAAVAALLAGAATVAFRVAVEMVPGYREALEARVSQEVGRPVSIRRMDLRWTDWRPTLVLRDAAVLSRDGDDVLVHLERVGLGFSPWRALQGEFVPVRVVLVGPSITVARTPDGGFRVEGLAATATADEERGGASDAVKRLSRIRVLSVRDARVRLRTPKYPRLGGVYRDVDLTLERADGGFTGTLGALPPQELGERLQLAFELRGLDRGLRHLAARGEVRLEDIPAMPWLAPILRPGVVLRGDLDSLQLGFRVDGGRLWRMTARARADRLAARIQGGEPGAQPILEGFQAAAEWQRVEDGWHLTLKDARVDGAAGLPVRLSAEFVRADDSFRVHIPVLSLGLLRPWLDILRLYGPEWLHRLEPTGRVQDLTATWPADNPNDWRVTGRFSGVDTNPIGRAPGISGLAGEARFDADGGWARLHLRGGLLRAPEVFQRPLPVDRFEGRLAWSRARGGWTVTGQDLSIAAVEAHAAGRFSVRLVPGAPPWVDLSATFSGQSMDAARPFVPKQLPDPAERWLPDALTAGRVSDGRLVIRGVPDDFPFAEHPGEFSMSFRIHDGALKYADNWPAATDIEAAVKLHGFSLSVRAEHARMMGEAIESVHGEIEDLRKAIVHLEGRTEAGIGRQLAFLAESPLRERFRSLLRAVDARGPAALALSLTLPLKNKDRARASGTITLRGARIEYRGWPKPLTNVRGQVGFSPQGLLANDVQVSMDGLLLSVDLRPQGGDETTRLLAQARVSLPRDRAAIAPYVPALILDRVAGESRWQLALTLGSDAGTGDVVLSSDLVGTRVEFPVPLAKAPAQPRPTRIRVQPEGGAMTIRVDYAERLNALLALSYGEAGWRLDRGEIRLGGGAASLPDRPGLWAAGQTKRADLAGWLSFVRAISGAGGTTAGAAPEPPAAGPRPAPGPAPVATTTLFKGGEIDIGVLAGYGQSWQSVSLRLERFEGGWQASVDAPDAAGLITIRPPWATPAPDDARTRVLAEMSRLSLSLPSLRSPAAGAGAASEPTNPASLPVGVVECGDCELNGLSLGSVRMQLQPLPDGLALTELTVNGTDLEASATGRWTRTDGLSEARLTAQMRTGGLQALFEALGYAPSVKAEESIFDADLKWSPDASGLELENLLGTLEFTLNDGVLLAVDPGAGRVLGLLNFYALPRRLLLNFRDVASEGLAFDTIEGLFEFRNGNAYTRRFVLESPALRMTMDGRIGLVERVYDQTVTVYPDVGVTLPIAGAVLGGPAVGAFLLLAQEILKKPIDQITQLQYHVGGTWENPRISEVQ